MTGAITFLAAIAAALAFSSQAAGAATLDDDPNARIVRLERWLKAALRHQPGAKDDALTEVALWSGDDLRALKIDERVMASLLRNPGLPVRVNLPKNSPIPAYTEWQQRRLRELAEQYRRYDDRDALIVRGALLHGDVAMSGADLLATPDPAGDNVRIQATDGEPVGVGGRTIHWDLARLLFDAARPAGDAVARQWYIATAAWMQNREQHDTLHLRHGREMFPDDPQLQFLSGCQQETYASPVIQAVARSVVLPAGYHVDVESESASLRDAEAYFRRALTLDPQMREARVRLAHVVIARGRPQDAVNELRNVDVSGEAAPLQYFYEMFLGEAEEMLGRFDQAREAYMRASVLSPDAQSPYLALSSLATRRRDRATALKESQRLFELPLTVGGLEDPGWAYRVAQARNADALLQALYRSWTP